MVWSVMAVLVGRSNRLVRFGTGVASVAILVFALVLSSPTAGATGDDLSPILSPRQAAPTLPGAPFLPSSTRDEIVLARLDALTQLDELRAAQAALETRTKAAGGLGSTGPLSNALALSAGSSNATAAATTPANAVPTSTVRILESRIASVERDLAALAEDSGPLLNETASYSMGMAAFPVAELRKPFFNDWGRPRSGGRTHKGNDMLAQTGVDLRAIEDGYVEKTSNGSLGGLSVYLIGDSGSRYYYAHLDEVGDVVEGQRVYAGQVVGTVGDSGNARGAPHLHMQWAPDGESGWENPFPLLDVLFGEGAAAEALAEVDEAPSVDPTDDPFLFDGGS